MKSNKEIFASMELNVQIAWERYYRNNLKMRLTSDQDRLVRLEKRSKRTGVEAENMGHSYSMLLNELGIKQKLDIYGIMMKALNEINEMYKEELEELAIKESRVG
jgi:hypothetical protein